MKYISNCKMKASQDSASNIKVKVMKQNLLPLFWKG